MSSDYNESIASEVLAASLGGAISASILYPLEVLKTKMQAQVKPETTTTTQQSSSNVDNEEAVGESKEQDDDDSGVFAVDSNETDDDNNKCDYDDTNELSMMEYANYLQKTEGPGVFVVGIETSAMQSATEKALYFFAYTGLKSIYRKLSGSQSMGSFTNLILGYLADWAHLPITLPIDCWTTAIQTDTTGRTSMQLLVNMLSEKGLKGMYKGIQAYVVLCLKPALQYTVFEQVKALLLKGRRRKILTAAESFVLGMVARTVATIVVFPYLRLKVILQTSENEHDPKSMQQLLLETLSQKDGVSQLFRGLKPELTRGVLSAALMLMIKEQITGVVHTALYGPSTPTTTTKQ